MHNIKFAWLDMIANPVLVFWVCLLRACPGVGSRGPRCLRPVPRGLRRDDSAYHRTGHYTINHRTQTPRVHDAIVIDSLMQLVPNPCREAEADCFLTAAWTAAMRRLSSAGSRSPQQRGLRLPGLSPALSSP